MKHNPLYINHDWFIKKINPRAEYFRGKDRWWDRQIISHGDHYKEERMIIDDLKGEEWDKNKLLNEYIEAWRR